MSADSGPVEMQVRDAISRQEEDDVPQLENEPQFVSEKGWETRMREEMEVGNLLSNVFSGVWYSSSRLC